MTCLTSLSLVQMAEMIRRKEISPVELVEAHFDRIEALRSKLNAFIHLDVDGARTRARAAEASVVRGDALGPLHGVPLTVKSCIDVAGWKCEAGSALRRDYIPAQDAVLVRRLRAAGAILLGNTNVPEFLMAYETNNSLYGRTSNPWSLDRSCGGSSGGEAASIASGCSAGGIGSDGGGSIRVPAHFCGVAGLKPTPGRIAATGHFPPGAGCLSWLGVVGPMARSIADVCKLFCVIAGPDPGDPCSAPVPLRIFSEKEACAARIGILESNSLGTATPETVAAVQHAAELLADQGFAVEPFRLMGLDRALELWWGFFGTTISHLLRMELGERAAEISPMLCEYLEVTAAEPPLTLDHLLAASSERDLLRANIIRQMERAPVLLSPVCSIPAFRHGEGSWRGPLDYRKTMRYSQWLNLTGFPGAVVPVSMSPQGLPVGVQVIGRPNEDELVLAVAERIELGLSYGSPVGQSASRISAAGDGLRVHCVPPYSSTMESAMQEQLSPLILELLNWIASRPRTYAEAMEVWRTSCPRHSVWEDAQLAGLIQTEGFGGKVTLTSRGRAMLGKEKPAGVSFPGKK